MLEDDGRADEIEDESIESYADRKGITISNPTRKAAMARKPAPTTADLKARIRELEEENQQLSDQLDSIADIVSPSDDEDEDDDSDGDDDSDDEE